MQLKVSGNYFQSSTLRDLAGNVANRSRKLKGTLRSLLEVRREKEELTLINQKHDAVEKRKYFGV